MLDRAFYVTFTANASCAHVLPDLGSQMSSGCCTAVLLVYHNNYLVAQV